MRVMVFVKATKESEAGMMPNEKVIAVVGTGVGTGDGQILQGTGDGQILQRQ